MEELKYNYVIIGSEGYYLVGYRDVIGLPTVSYHANYNAGFKGRLPRLLVRWNFSRQLNKYVHTPFSWYVYPKLYPHQFNDDKPICYIFFGNRQYIFQTSYLSYLRKHVPGVKIVLYMQDLVARNIGLHLDTCSSQFDLMVSYDQGDALRYGMAFHPTPMSVVDIPEDDCIPRSDVYFCGYAKNRYGKIHETYKKCVQAGLVCDFNILDLPPGVPRLDGIHYIDKPFDYLTNLQHVKKTRCVIEIMQEGADGFTPRLWESIVYDKHLLTNNSKIEQSPYYFEKGCHLLTHLSNDNITDMLNEDVLYPYALKESLSPKHLLQFIDQKLADAE